MMKIDFSEIAKKEFLDLDKPLQIKFKSAIEKIIDNPIKRHLKYGIPSHVINVGKQSRLIYNMVDDRIIILHCFAVHSDYEKWFKSYR